MSLISKIFSLNHYFSKLRLLALNLIMILLAKFFQCLEVLGKVEITLTLYYWSKLSRMSEHFMDHFTIDHTFNRWILRMFRSQSCLIKIPSVSDYFTSLIFIFDLLIETLSKADKRKEVLYTCHVDFMKAFDCLF